MLSPEYRPQPDNGGQPGSSQKPRQEVPPYTDETKGRRGSGNKRRTRREGEKGADELRREELNAIAEQKHKKPFDQLTPKQQWEIRAEKAAKLSEAVERELKARRDAYEEERFDWNKFLAGRGGEGKPLAQDKPYDKTLQEEQQDIERRRREQ